MKERDFHPDLLVVVTGTVFIQRHCTVHGPQLDDSLFPQASDQESTETASSGGGGR